MKLVYIAHPLVGDKSAEWGNFVHNLTRYMHFVALFQNAGIAVASWAHNVLMHERGLSTDTSADFYLNIDRVLLTKCDALIKAGPEVISTGMQHELMWARQLNIPIFSHPIWNDRTYLPPINPEYSLSWEQSIIRQIKEMK